MSFESDDETKIDFSHPLLLPTSILFFWILHYLITKGSRFSRGTIEDSNSKLCDTTRLESTSAALCTSIVVNGSFLWRNCPIPLKIRSHVLRLPVDRIVFYRFFFLFFSRSYFYFLFFSFFIHFLHLRSFHSLSFFLSLRKLFPRYVDS